MHIRAIIIEPVVAIKLFEKHNIRQEEVYHTLKEGKPQFRKVGGEQYVAIGQAQSKYITIFFRYDIQTKEAEITTAYPSDQKQIRWHKKVTA